MEGLGVTLFSPLFHLDSTPRNYLFVLLTLGEMLKYPGVLNDKEIFRAVTNVSPALLPLVRELNSQG